MPNSKDFEQFKSNKGMVYTGPLIYDGHTNPAGAKKYIIVYLWNTI